MQLRYCDLREWRKKLVDYSGNSNNIIFFFFARSIFHSDYSFQLVIFVDSFVNKWSIVASCRSNLVLLKMLPKFSFLVMEHRTRLRKLISLIENSFFPPFFFSFLPLMALLCYFLPEITDPSQFFFLCFSISFSSLLGENRTAFIHFVCAQFPNYYKIGLAQACWIEPRGLLEAKVLNCWNLRGLERSNC